MLSNFLFPKPKNVGNAKCRPTIDQVSTNYWPIHRSSIDQLSTNYRQSVGEMSAKCRWTKSYIGRDTSGTTIDRVSTDYRPLCRPTVDRVSTESRPSIDPVSTECRPTIDRVSTEYRPTVDRVSTAISTDISVDITHSKQDPWTKHISLLTGECYMDMLWFIFLSQVIFLFLLLLGMVIIIMPMFWDKKLTTTYI